MSDPRYPSTWTYNEIIAAEKREERRNLIIISHPYPPIPVRTHDYSAVRASYEPGDMIGYGATPEAAEKDLLEQEAES